MKTAFLTAGLIATVGTPAILPPVHGQQIPPNPAPHSVTQATPTPRLRPKRTLPDGRRVIADELKVTLREPTARTLSLQAAERSRAINPEALRALHPEIQTIEARHTSVRRWLNGQELPRHLQKPAGQIPRIARRFTLILQGGSDVVRVRDELRQHPRVERVDYKTVMELHSVPNDSAYTNQWAPPLIGLEPAWDIPSRGRIRVAVVDTGVDMSHAEFAGRIVFDDGYADLDDGNPPGPGTDFDHGTHVAGIIAATRDNGVGVAGFSNDIDLMVMNCATWDDDDNKWKISDADDAIDDAVDNGAHIINCSFSFSEDIEDEVEDAFDHSVLVVHSAGNDAQDIGGHWESPSIALFTVSATMQDGSATPSDVFDGGYSNFGKGIDLAAPGTGIWSTVPGSYGSKNGTSMAAPQVSGAAALVMSMNPLLIGDESTRHLLIRMAVDKGTGGYDSQYGFGALRLSAPTLKVCRDATTFLSSASTLGEGGNYDRPWRSIPAALANVPDGATLVLNGGTQDAPVYSYPAITITKPCTLTAIPDRPVIIGVP
jgi:subtilisin family serine protease